ncbi:MAG: Asp23/Gls24 family envelope stress response protein [Clostridia bacterium]
MTASNTTNHQISDNVIIVLVEKVVRESPCLSLSKKKKPVRIYAVEDSRKLDVSVEVEYGCDIPAAVKAFQRRVKFALEKVTGIEIKEVNVTVDGLNLESIIEQ